MGHVQALLSIFGEALVDEVGSSEILGGGPFNVARAAARLGGPAVTVTFVSQLSTDAGGVRQRDELVDDGVDTTHVQTSARPSGRAIAIFHGDEVSYDFVLTGTAAAHLDATGLPSGTTHACFGSLSLWLQPGADRYRALLHEARARGVLTLLDPNIRPLYLVGHPGWRGELGQWVSDVDIVKLSDEDLAELDGLPLDGPVAIVTTHGAAGLSVRTDTVAVTVPARQVTVADPIGAGDTVCAALLVWFANHGVRRRVDLADLDETHWRDALEWSAAAAAVTVTRVGADPPWAFEVPNR